MQLQKIKPHISKKTIQTINENKVASLDIGCGEFKRKGAIGMDIRPMPGVDIVWDITRFPWPLPDNTFDTVTASHVLEHIPKWGTPPQVHMLAELLIKKKLLTRKEVEKEIGETQIFSNVIRLMDEAWRVMKVGGQLAFVLPYAGSTGFYQDPTHTSPINEATFFYFDPTHYSKLWTIYKPKPWKIELSAYQTEGNIEVILAKLPIVNSYEEAQEILKEIETTGKTSKTK